MSFEWEVAYGFRTAYVHKCHAQRRQIAAFPCPHALQEKVNPSLKDGRRKMLSSARCLSHSSSLVLSKSEMIVCAGVAMSLEDIWKASSGILVSFLTKEEPARA